MRYQQGRRVKKTITELLADAGYSHGLTPDTDTTGKHVIWHTETGALEGYMSPDEAVNHFKL